MVVFVFKDLMVYVSMRGKMTGLFRFFTFSRYRYWENATNIYLVWMVAEMEYKNKFLPR
tara:strand:- start:285 stop:461 length:177 start_codon:yes stop_codon:yes gene_type:complete